MPSPAPKAEIRKTDVVMHDESKKSNAKKPATKSNLKKPTEGIKAAQPELVIEQQIPAQQNQPN